MFELAIKKKDLKNFCIKNHIKRLSLFGSALNGNMNAGSDIDLLVEFYEENIPG